MDKDTQNLARKAASDGQDTESVVALLQGKLHALDEAGVLEGLTRIPRNIRAQVLAMTSLLPVRQQALELQAMTPDVMNMVDRQMQRALGSLSAYNVNPAHGDRPMPSQEAIYRSVERQLTLNPETARQILLFAEPRLIIIPITSAERHRKALSPSKTPKKKKMKGQNPAMFSDFAENQLNAQATSGDTIVGYRFAITDGKQMLDVPEWDDAQLENFGQRIQLFNTHFQNTAVQGLDYSGFAGLMAQELEDGKPTGCKYEDDSVEKDASYQWQYTLLNGEPTEIGLVAVGRWNPGSRKVNLNDDYLVSRDDDARLRPSVMGEIE